MNSIRVNERASSTYNHQYIPPSRFCNARNAHSQIDVNFESIGYHYNKQNQM